MQNIQKVDSTLLHRGKLRELFYVLNVWKWRLLGITGLVCAATAALLSQLPPEYRAESLLLIEFSKKPASASVLEASSSDVSTLQTEIETLKSTHLLGRVVSELQLDRDPRYRTARHGVFEDIAGQASSLYRSWFGDGRSEFSEDQTEDGARAHALATLSHKLQISARNRSTAIEVALDSADAAQAKRIVESVVGLYLVEKLQAKVDTDNRDTDWFNKHLDELKRTVDSAEAAETAFRKKASLTSREEAANASLSIAELNTQLSAIRSLRTEKEARLAALQEAANDPAKIGVIPQVLADPLIASLRSQEAEAVRRIAELDQRYGASHPRMVQAIAEHSRIQAQIGAAIAKIIVSVQNDLESTKAKELQLQSQIERMDEITGRSGAYQTELRRRVRDVQASQVEYEEFLKRAKEHASGQNAREVAARILSPAIVLPDAVYPNYELPMVLAFLGSLLFGVAFAVGIEGLGLGLRNSDQIEQITGRVVLGMIPALPKSIKRKFLPANFIVAKPTSAYAESIRSIFAALMLRSFEKLPKVIMITSSVPGEGKSTFASSVASLVARSNPDKKVMLVDCDLRRSSLQKCLGASRLAGTVDEYLAGTKALKDVTGRVESSGLYYISAKADTINSAEILGSKAMQSFVRALSAEFDFVFLDTPPLMAVADAQMAAQISDYVIFLVRWEQTRRELVVNALKLLGNIRADVGIVLSQVNVRRHARYGYGDYGYSYSRYRNYYTS
jgi:succinoglycan biosynthesis transport protein ExoP